MRRSLNVFVICCLSFFLGAQPILVVGSYAKDNDATSFGAIETFRFDTKTGNATPLDVVEYNNPSFLTVDKQTNELFAVNETEFGEVLAVGFDPKTGTIQHKARKLTNGEHPCHITLDPSKQWVLVGNYSSGSISVFKRDTQNSISTLKQYYEHEGSGPNAARQQSPHVHQVVFSPNNQIVCVPDLGIDKVMLYRFDATNGRLTPNEPAFIALSAGAGPRHMAFSKNGKYVYVVEELLSRVSVFRFYENGRTDYIQTVDVSTPSYAGPKSSADIHISPNGKYLYVSNRGSDNSIGIYKIRKNGRLQYVSHMPSGGLIPRNFNFSPDGKWLLVANQESHSIAVFACKSKGQLEDTNIRIPCVKPVCIAWLNN